MSPLHADETNDPPPFHYLTNNLAIPTNAPHSLTFVAPPCAFNTVAAAVRYLRYIDQGRLPLHLAPPLRAVGSDAIDNLV